MSEVQKFYIALCNLFFQPNGVTKGIFIFPYEPIIKPAKTKFS